MSKNLNPSLNGTVYHHKNEKIFKKITCNYCIRPIVYISDKNKLNRYFDSMIIKCPYDDCHKEFNRIVCPLCSEVNIIEEGKYFMGHKVKCSGCRNFFGKILCQKCLKELFIINLDNNDEMDNFDKNIAKCPNCHNLNKIKDFIVIKQKGMNSSILP